MDRYKNLKNLNHTPTSSVLGFLEAHDLRKAELFMLKGGRNSIVYLVKSSSRRYVLKKYPDISYDIRDRIGTEIQVLNFLRKKDIRNISRPISWNFQSKIALFDYVEGELIKTATDDLFASVLYFLEKLIFVAKDPRAHSLPNASEACFSIQSHFNLVFSRLSDLEDLIENVPVEHEISKWISMNLRPSIEKTLANILTSAPQRLVSETIPLSQKIISPSDVGIHNMLRIDDQYVFLDFEYAGWDDLAKFTVDWILQPDNLLEVQSAFNFLRGIVNLVPDRQIFISRIAILLDIYRIKWCVIMFSSLLRNYSEKTNNQVENVFDKIKKYYLDSSNLITAMNLIDSQSYL